MIKKQVLCSPLWGELCSSLSRRYRYHNACFIHRVPADPAASSPKRRSSIKVDDSGEPGVPPIVYGCREAVAYAAHRMPAVYGVMERVFREAHCIMSSRSAAPFQPQSMLDCGTGPGTAIM